MDWKGMLDLDVMSLSNTSGISTLSSKCRFKGTVSWVAPVVVSQWLERRQDTGKVPQGACDKKVNSSCYRWFYVEACYACHTHAG